MNIDAVDLLTRIHMPSVIDALSKRDLGLARMADGRELTPDELELLKKVGPAELTAARDYMKRAAEAARDEANAVRRLSELAGKYTTSPDDTIGQIRPRMSEQDGAEFDSLTWAVH